MINEEAARLHRKSIIIDGLNASYFRDFDVISSIYRGGVTAVNATIAAWQNPDETRVLIDEASNLLATHSDLLMHIRSASDILKAKSENKLGFILGFQDTIPIGDDTGLLDEYQRLGVHVIQLTYNTTNRVGSGYTEKKDNGISHFGRQVIKEMNRLGILIDLSHSGDRTTLEAIALSDQPVCISHANSREFCNNKRNKTNETLLALRDKGGIIGAMRFPLTLTGKYYTDLDDYLDSIDYLVNLLGIDYVGIGTDFMEKMPLGIKLYTLKNVSIINLFKFLFTCPVKNFETASEFPNVTEKLISRGYSPEDVQKIMGLNWFRLYGQVWK
ncbi:MAG: dipeptidase [Nanoarchaeota archaeon]|nr:dipeptidase [Nanoarchaeota archaeon]